jgi:hypothetical protein
MGEQDAYLQLPGKGCLLARPSSVSVRSSPRSGRLLLLPSITGVWGTMAAGFALHTQAVLALRCCSINTCYSITLQHKHLLQHKQRRVVEGAGVSVSVSVFVQLEREQEREQEQFREEVTC